VSEVKTCGARVTVQGVHFRCARPTHRDATHRVGYMAWNREAGSWMRREVGFMRTPDSLSEPRE
jgi:hypothetical protein